MSEQEKAAELAKLRDYLAHRESGPVSYGHGPDAPPFSEREIGRARARIAELEAHLGI